MQMTVSKSMDDPFEIAGVLLLIAIVGAVVLTRKGTVISSSED